MRFAEVFLRLGVSLVGWMVIFAYLLWLLVLPQVPCSPGEPSLWAVLLGATPVVALFALLLPSSRRLPGVHDVLRYAALPTLLLAALGLRIAGTALLDNTLGDARVCGLASQFWSSAWAPIQLGMLLFIALQAWRCFRPPA